MTNPKDKRDLAAVAEQLEAVAAELSEGELTEDKPSWTLPTADLARSAL
jgi:hypothetical protein